MIEFFFKKIVGNVIIFEIARLFLLRVVISKMTYAAKPKHKTTEIEDS